MDSGAACLLFIGLIIIVVLIDRSQNRQQFLKQLEQARLAYQQALDELKSEPTNPDVKQRALEFGRHYSQLTREGEGITVFDEVALMNDINAATAGASASPQPSQGGAGKASIEERLEKLSELKSKGLIDDQEYAERKRRILDEV